jgi:hypothetical protein
MVRSPSALSIVARHGHRTILAIDPFGGGYPRNLFGIRRPATATKMPVVAPDDR